MKKIIIAILILVIGIIIFLLANYLIHKDDCCSCCKDKDKDTCISMCCKCEGAIFK